MLSVSGVALRPIGLTRRTLPALASGLDAGSVLDRMDASPRDPHQVTDPTDADVDPGVDTVAGTDVDTSEDASVDGTVDSAGTSNPLPQPPPAFGTPDEPPAREQRPGELTTGWRVVFAIGWIGVILGIAAVWKSSRTLGLPLWWLGPEANPRPLPVQMVPFLLPVVMIIGAVRSLRHLPWLGLVAAAATVAIAVPDLDRFPGLATVEIALGVAGALVSAASLAGVLVRAD